MTQKDLIAENEPCLNCDEVISGYYCRKCGQKAIDNVDRSISRFLGDFLGNILFLDNRFFLSLRYLLLKPGRMTVEFLGGKRKKFLPPVTLFLFVNLLYFFQNPLTDYSLPLHDQVGRQFYSITAKKMVDERLASRDISFNSYKVTYQKASDNISKTVMILNVPLIAVFVYLISFRSRIYYFDSLVFSFHFFSLFLLSITAGDLITDIIPWLEKISFYDQGVMIMFFILLVPISNAIGSLRKFTKTNWLFSTLGGLFIYVGIFITQLTYRGIIFLLTFYTT